MEETIPGYIIKKKICVGGMATIFLAEDIKHQNRPVALKLLHLQKTQDQLTVDRFIKEAKLLIQFEHINIVKGYEYGNFKSVYFFSMEYIDGKSILEIIEKTGPLPEPMALDITIQLAKALEYIHREGIVHMDIKPANVIITKDTIVKLCDLGFAQPIGSGSHTHSDIETTSGTVQYMSPEQAMGQKDIDIRSDIYSLGVTLYHMVMGDIPFKGTNSLEVMAKQVLELLNSSVVKNRGISQHMHYFIERMMVKEKELRYANPTELIEDISAQIEGFKSLQFDAKKGKPKR